jgi:uncharacterized circularly permuted ATP-grasp superfamily protein
MKLFEEYKEAFFDEMLTESGVIQEQSQSMAENLQELEMKGLSQKQKNDWHLRQNGVSHNINGTFFDEMFTGNGDIREHWQPLVENLQELDINGLAQKQEEIDWQLRENGVSYNIYDDSEPKRKWNLDPIPFILSEDEFEVLERGIKQRFNLLEHIFKDIYGDQQLLKSGIIPAEILYLDSHFIREAYGFKNSYYDLAFYAADLSRGPDGKFWVISDKT